MTYNQSIGFGSGFMFMTPAAGGTPIRVGLLQDVALDISFEEKLLHGQNQWAVAIARGKAKGTIKAKSAVIDSGAIATIFLGGTPVAGADQIADLEAGVVPGSTTYTIQVSKHANYVADLGVWYATTGQPLQQVAGGSEATGKYSVAQSGGSKGTYTFAVGDASAAVLISYKYNDGTSGFMTTLSNLPMGTTQYFQVDLYQNNPEVAGSQWAVKLYRCSSSKIALATKQDDWTIPEFDASIQANAAGKVLDFNAPV